MPFNITVENIIVIIISMKINDSVVSDTYYIII